MPNAKILIVDDNVANLKLARLLLESEGFKITTATDADEVLKMLPNDQPHLILMDIQLPSMDGLTLSRLIKANPEYETIAIVALTAYAMKGDAERAQASGCCGYITKPIDTRTFASTITDYLNSARGVAQTPQPLKSEM